MPPASCSRFCATHPAGWPRRTDRRGLGPRLGRARPGGRVGSLGGAAADGETGHQLIGQFRSFPACMQVQQDVSAPGPNRGHPLRPHSKADVVPSPPVSAPGWLPAKHTPASRRHFGPFRVGWTFERVCCGPGISGVFVQQQAESSRQPPQGCENGAAAWENGRLCGVSGHTNLSNVGNVWRPSFLMGFGHHWRRFVRHRRQWRRVCTP